MSDPTTLRALAARVCAEGLTEALRFDAFMAAAPRPAGYDILSEARAEWRRRMRLYEHMFRIGADLSAAASLMPAGWSVCVDQYTSAGIFRVFGFDNRAQGWPPDPATVRAEAPTEPQARVAAALLARAAEMEAGDG